MEEPSSPNKSIPLVIPVAPPVPIPAGVSAVPDPPIRTLKVELLSHNSSKYIPCQPNSREPTPFETEFFKGIAMIMVRTKPVDPFFQSFFNGKSVISPPIPFLTLCADIFHAIGVCLRYRCRASSSESLQARSWSAPREPTNWSSAC